MQLRMIIGMESVFYFYAAILYAFRKFRFGGTI